MTHSGVSLRARRARVRARARPLSGGAPFGIRVLKFPLGFNPKLLNFRRGDTEYGIGALPLGGYVKMAGENPEETRTGAPDEFLSKTQVAALPGAHHGPVMNLLLARRAAWRSCSYQGADVPLYRIVGAGRLGAVAAGSPGRRRRHRPGDRIVSVDGRDVDDVGRVLSMAVLPKARPGSSRSCVRAQRRSRRDGDADSRRQASTSSATSACCPVMHPVVTQVNPGTPAERAGLQAGRRHSRRRR